MKKPKTTYTIYQICDNCEYCGMWSIKIGTPKTKRRAEDKVCPRCGCETLKPVTRAEFVLANVQEMVLNSGG